MKLASVFNFLLFQVNYGAHIRSRTGDLFITNEVLYRLSYASLTCISSKLLSQPALCQL